MFTIVNISSYIALKIKIVDYKLSMCINILILIVKFSFMSKYFAWISYRRHLYLILTLIYNSNTALKRQVSGDCVITCLRPRLNIMFMVLPSSKYYVNWSDQSDLDKKSYKSSLFLKILPTTCHKFSSFSKYKINNINF